MSGKITERWEVWRNSAIPYIGKITVLQPDGSVLDCPPVYCRFLWERWHNFDRSELVIRTLVICGQPVDMCEFLVEKGYTVLEWIEKPTINPKLSTGYEHQPEIKTF